VLGRLLVLHQLGLLAAREGTLTDIAVDGVLLHVLEREILPIIELTEALQLCLGRHFPWLAKYKYLKNVFLDTDFSHFFCCCYLLTK